jgi:hypothetical protein
MGWEPRFHKIFEMISKYLLGGTDKYHKNTAQHMRNYWTEI